MQMTSCCSTSKYGFQIVTIRQYAENIVRYVRREAGNGMPHIRNPADS